MSKPPILIFGVPRSGTTLLRTLLNAHPAIACGPEAPWLANHQPNNVMALYESLTAGDFAFTRNFGVPPEQVRGRLRELIDGLFTDFARRQGKARWAHKTPDDCLYAPFFTQLFPDARYLHLTRHPLDVALSTARIPAHRKGVSPWHEENLVLEPGCAAKNNLFNCVLRWRRWNDRLNAELAGRACHHLVYEDLVGRPEETMAAVCAFLDEPYSPAILDYAKSAAIFPAWEWGSADVRAAGRITAARVGRWRVELTPDESRLLLTLAGAADRPEIRAVAGLADAAEAASPLFSSLVAGVNAFAAPFGLSPVPDSIAGWAPAWLWFNGLWATDWPAARIIDFGSGLSPWPWLLATLGARVTLVDRDAQWVPAWQSLRDRLRVSVDWQIAAPNAVLLPEACADVGTCFAPPESAAEIRGLVTAAASLLKPGARLFLSLAFGEPAAPGDQGRAITPTEFEREIWGHPAFGHRGRPAWSPSGPAAPPPAHEATGAAVLLKRA